MKDCKKKNFLAQNTAKDVHILPTFVKTITNKRFEITQIQSISFQCLLGCLARIRSQASKFNNTRIFAGDLCSFGWVWQNMISKKRKTSNSLIDSHNNV